MGVTIHYRGTIDDPKRVGDLQRELTDIAESIGWKSQTLDDDWAIPPRANLVHTDVRATIIGHLGLKGIDLIPDGKGEPVSFLFDATGHLCSVMSMILICEGQLAPDEAWVSVKTQFLSPDAHIWIVGLLKYLKKRYLPNLEVRDEGDYWETGDRAALEAKMRFLNEKMAWLSGELKSARFAHLTGLSADDIASRIEDFLREDNAPPSDHN
jgi:hypothetical protein